MVIIAAELLKRANELVKNNIHPTVVMAGYRLAVKEAVKYVKSNLVVSADSLGRTNLINAGMISSLFTRARVDKLTLIHQRKRACHPRLLAQNLTSSPSWQ